MATTLTGYTPGTAGANWFVSNEMKTKFDEMAKAVALAVPRAQITLSTGYVSRYELIRELTTKYAYTDQALKDKVTNVPSNGSITPEEWNTLESYFNADANYGASKPAAYKYMVHPYIQGDSSFVSEFPNKPNSDLRRTGLYVGIKSNGYGAQSIPNWNLAEWMLKNSHRYGFFFTGPTDDLYTYQPNWTFGSEFQSRLDTYGNRIWLLLAAENSRFAALDLNLGIPDIDARIKEECKQQNMPVYDKVVQKLTNTSNATEANVKAAIDAAKLTAWWLHLAEKY